MNSRGHIFYVLLTLFIFLLPVNNSFEVVAMMNGLLPYRGWSIQLTPTSLKLYKDVFFVLFFILLFIGFLKYKDCRHQFNIPFVFPILFFLFVVILSFFFSLRSGDYFSAISGLRSYLCLVYLLVGISVSYYFDYKRISTAFIIVFLIHLTLQIVQYLMAVGLPVFGEMRSPGIFIVPATSGLFSLLAIFYFKHCEKWWLFFISLLSLVLSTSTIGLLSLVVAYSYTVSDRLFGRNVLVKSIVSFSLLIISISVFFLYAAQLSGRGDAVFESLNGRISIITSFFDSAGFDDFVYGGRFGLVTAQAVLSNQDAGFVADNTFLALYASMGFFSLIPFVIFVVLTFILSRDKILPIGMLLYAMTANIFELSPVSQLLFLFIGINIGGIKYVEHNFNRVNYKNTKASESN
ncbi:hypothetical protein [Tolumonas lignilytica]|uniref:hypothetical protein n=1 Tax=Tolumonas lignilytica TaxID=1283284 RepID=UPI0004675043|nr:hypothetical protein [Tolumonas lignilytica]